MSPREQELYFRFLRSGRRVVTRARVQETLGIGGGYASKLLHQLAKRGAAAKAAKGIYVLAPADAVQKGRLPVIDPWSVLDELLKLLSPDYFVAYASAAYLHGAVTEVPYNIQVAIPRQRRPIHVGNARVTFHIVRRDRWGGTQRVRQSGEYVTVSDPERTLVDCASRPELCGGADGLAQIAWELAWKAHPALVGTYLRKIADPGAANRLGYIVHRLKRHKAPKKVMKLLQVLDQQKGAGTYALDRGGARTGDPLDRRWHVIVNADVEAWRRA